MKKLMISLLAIAATMNVMAITYNTKATITLTSADKQSSCSITIGESDDLTDELTNGYYAELNEEGRNLALYVVYNDVKYQDFAKKSLSDIKLGIMTPGAETDGEKEYTVTVSNVKLAEGKTLSFKLGDKTIDITDAQGSTTTVKLPSGVAYYDATKPATKKTYGAINPAPTVPQICHIGDNLEITGYAGASWYVQVVGYEHNTFVALGEVEIKKDVEQINLKQINVDETATTYKNQYKVLMYRLVDGQKQDEKTPLVIYYEKN